MYDNLNLNSKDPARQSSQISPVPLTKVPNLKEICAVGVAISLWKHINVPVESWKLNSNRSSLCTVNLPRLTSKITNLTVELPVPKLTVDYINTLVNKICFQIEDWVTYHHVMIFFGNGSNFHLYHHIPYFIWYLDGTINYKETARNLLSSHRLSDIEKYKFLCTYCLEDEMTTLAPLLIMNDVFELVSLNSHPLILYWNLYFKNALQKIPLQESLTLDNHMFQLNGVNNWWAKEYFFNRLKPQDQVDKVRGAIMLIDWFSDHGFAASRFGVWYLKLILMNLSESERVKLYTKKGVLILQNYSQIGICGNEILSTWYAICDLIDADQFIIIFQTLLRSRYYTDTILTEIWTCSSDHFKYYLSTYNNHGVIRNVFTSLNSKFLFTVLSDLNVDVRRSIAKTQFFTEHCIWLLEKHRLPIFERLITICLPIQELDQFTTLQVNTVFNTYLKYAIFLDFHYYSPSDFRIQFDFGRLDAFLTWYFSTPCRVKEYKLLRINSYSDIPVINSLLRKKDERHLKLVMSWFFDGDQKEIDEFKKKLKKKHGKAGKISWVRLMVSV